MVIWLKSNILGMENKTPYDWSGPCVGLLTPCSCEIPSFTSAPNAPQPPLHPFHLESICSVGLDVGIYAKLVLLHFFPVRVHPSHMPLPPLPPHRAHGAKFFLDLNLTQSRVFSISRGIFFGDLASVTHFPCVPKSHRVCKRELKLSVCMSVSFSRL